MPVVRAMGAPGCGVPAGVLSVRLTVTVKMSFGIR